MKTARRLGHRLLNPHPVVGAVVVVASGLLTALALATENAKSPWALLVYPFVCYALVLVVRGAVLGARWARCRVMACELSRRYATDMEFRTRIEVHVSLVVDGLYGLFMLGSGLLGRSLWFGATGLYYLVLTLLHTELVRSLHRGGGGYAEGLRTFGRCGWLLLALAAAYSAVVAQMVADGRGSEYPGYFIYVAAMFAFYSMGTAVRNLLRSRRFENPVMWATKALDLSTALVSVLSLQTAMFASFGEGREGLRAVMNGVTGLVVCGGIATIAVVMIVRARSLGRS